MKEEMLSQEPKYRDVRIIYDNDSDLIFEQDKKPIAILHDNIPAFMTACSELTSGGLTFTPGVPTEDGWYVVKVEGTYEAVEIIGNVYQWNRPQYIGRNLILSHAKLPEL